MQTGVKISAGVHGAVLAWVLVGGTIFRPAPPDPAPMAVTLISAPVFDAMRAPAPEAPQDAPRAARRRSPSRHRQPRHRPGPAGATRSDRNGDRVARPGAGAPAAEPAPATSPLAVAPRRPTPRSRRRPRTGWRRSPDPPRPKPCRAPRRASGLAPAPDAPPVTQAPAPAARRRQPRRRS
ncbi:MAG: hypothetical protein JKP98_20660 [Rhodobacteraceae bacterium]|nr:hypothetical protein [Paracoccaceae bacterium]